MTQSLHLIYTVLAFPIPNGVYLKTKNLVLRTRSNILAMLSFPSDPIGNPESKLTLDSRKACPRENGDTFGNDILGRRE